MLFDGSIRPIRVRRHILILSGNLAGLITAYRLVPYGFRITVLEPAQHSSPSASQEIFSWSGLPGDWDSSLSEEPSPLILHNFYDSTWSLLQELALDQSEPPFQNIALEFTTTAEQTVSVADPLRLSSVHPIMRLALFKGLAWSDRWHLINFLEKIWEEQPRFAFRHAHRRNLASFSQAISPCVEKNLESAVSFFFRM